MMTARKRVELLVTQLSANLENRVSLAEAARSVGIEATYLSKLFRQYTGMTFSEWNRRIRVKRAKSYLQDSSLSVTTIANRLGYSDLTTFERHFRAVEGIPPKKYQLLWRKKQLHTLAATDRKFKLGLPARIT